MRFLIICVLAYVVLCSAKGKHRRLQKNCLAEFLLEREKLTTDSKIYETLTEESCTDPIDSDYFRSFVLEGIKEVNEANVADCVTEQFDDDDFDNIVISALIASTKSSLEEELDPELEPQYTEAQNALMQKIEDTAGECDIEQQNILLAALQLQERISNYFE